MKRHRHSIGAFTTVLAASLVMDSTAFANEQTDQQEIINIYRWWAQGFEQKNLNQVFADPVLNYTQVYKLCKATLN